MCYTFFLIFRIFPHFSIFSGLAHFCPFYRIFTHFFAFLAHFLRIFGAQGIFFLTEKFSACKADRGKVLFFSHFLLKVCETTLYKLVSCITTIFVVFPFLLLKMS